MAAWGIEELSTIREVTEFKVLRFQYRWMLNKWIAEKPETRRAAMSTSSLDTHLKFKAQVSHKTRFKDTRRVKV